MDREWKCFGYKGQGQIGESLWRSAFVLFAPVGWAATDVKDVEGISVHSAFDGEWDKGVPSSRWNVSELLWRERYRGENAHCWCQVRVGSETLKSDEFI